VMTWTCHLCSFYFAKHMNSLFYVCRVSAGQGKLEKFREFVWWSGKSQGKILFWQVREKSVKMMLDDADCRYPWFFASPSIEKQTNLRLPLNVQKLEMFQLQGVKPTWHPNQGPCCLHIVPLILFHYFMI